MSKPSASSRLSASVDGSAPFALALGADPSVVQLGDLSSDGEAQTASPHPAAMSLLTLVKPVEYPLAVGHGNARSGVAHFEDHVIALTASGQGNNAAIRGMLDRV